MGKKKFPGQGELFIVNGDKFEYTNEMELHASSKEDLPKIESIINTTGQKTQKMNASEQNQEYLKSYKQSKTILLGNKKFDIKIGHTENQINTEGVLQGLSIKIRPQGESRYWHFVIHFEKPFYNQYYTSADGERHLQTKIGVISHICKTNAVNGSSVYYTAKGGSITNFNYFSYLFKIDKQYIHTNLMREIGEYCRTAFLQNET